MLPVMKKTALPAFLFASVLMSATAARADDTEIYFSSPEGGGEANIVMMLDTSGSMATNECVEWDEFGSCTRRNKRLDELKTALFRVVDALGSNARIGLGRYNQNDGGRLLYPVRGLDEIDFDGITRVYLLNDAADANDDPGEALDHSSATEYLPNDGQVGSVTGFIFQRNSIPRHAAVSAAYIEVSAASNSSMPVDYEYWYEPSISPALFDVAEIIDPARTFSANTWKGRITGSWSRYGTYKIDVTDAVKEAMADPFWCGGGDFALYMGNSVSGSTDRLIYMRDAVRVNEGDEATAYAPRLVVEWDATVAPTLGTPGTTGYESSLACRNGMRFGLGSSLDDAHDDGSDLDNQDTDLRLDTDSVAGLRFTRIPYDLSAAATNPDVLRAARLYIQGDNNNSSFTLTVRAVPGDAAEFDTAPGSIKGLPAGSKVVNYTVPRGTFANRHEIDVTDLVAEAMSDSGWVRNGSIALLVTTSRSTTIDSYESGAANAAYLELDISATDMKTFVPRVRDKIKEAAAGLTAYGNTPSMEAYSEMARYYLGENFLYLQEDVNTRVGLVDGTNQYDTPIIKGSCTSNNIVLLTDGSPTNDADYSSVTSLTGKTACNGGLNREGGSYNCQVQLAEWLYDGTENGLNVPVATHTIAFTSDSDIRANMKRVSDAGNGMHRWARNADELQAAFEEIINSVTVENASMAAPGVAVNQLNRFQHLDQLYYGLFKPSTNTRWEGNLKRYRLRFSSNASEVGIVDEQGVAAVDPNTGFFKETSDSWWGTGTDGQDVASGGAREELAGTRTLMVDKVGPAAGSNMYQTTKPTGTGLTTITAADASFAVSATDLGMAAGAPQEDIDTRVRWLLNAWGDPLHSEPRLVNYGYSGTLEEALVDPSRQDNTVFVATNDGMLHAINTNDGSEYFAFMPKEELAKTNARFQNAALTAPNYSRGTYGLDGGITVWRKGDGGRGVERVIVFMGQRRGGDRYYAVDVTDRSAPKVLWSIKGGSGDFPQLAQTWSTPALAQVMLNGTKVPVLIFGGGYSAADHDPAGNVSTGDAGGNAIYIVNAFSGAKIWAASSVAAGSDVTHSDMKWSIPGQIATIDINQDGVVDHLYATDLGGQILRVDLNSSNTGPGSLAYRVVTLAKLGTSDASGIDNHRRFYAPPVAALGVRDGKRVVHVVVGSGYRARPTDLLTSDRLYVVDDEQILTALAPGGTVPSAITPSDMTNVTSTAVTEVVGKGWYINLEEGEKVMAPVAIVDGKIFATTYLPRVNNVDACTQTIGGARLYTLGLGTGAAVGDTRYVDLVLPGLPPQAQVLLQLNPQTGPDDGVGEGGGDGGTGDETGGAGGDCPATTVVIVGTQAQAGACLDVGSMQRTRWYEKEDKAAADQVLEALKPGATQP